MASEFVRLNHAEKIYGQKHLIQSQLELLNIAKSFASYKVMRGEELKLKINLKSKIGETLALIEKLNGLLPKSHYKESAQDKENKKEKKESWEKSKSIQEEMDDLQKKLMELQRGM